MTEVRKDLFIGIGFLVAAIVLASFAIAIQAQAREGVDDSVSSQNSFGVKFRGDGTVDDTQPEISSVVQVQAQVQAQEQINVSTTSAGKANRENKKTGQVNVAEHRSAVANFVQGLLQVADRETGGIGQQVRNIAQQQNQSTELMVQAMGKVQTRSKIKTFLLGSDYKNLGQLRSQMVQTRNRLQQLNQIMSQVENEADKTELQNQIQALLQEQVKIENFVATEESKISLFGWLVKMFK